MTNSTKKVTKAQRFSDIQALLRNEPTSFGTDVETAIAFIDHELTILANKNKPSDKPTAAQEQNKVYSALILQYLAGCENSVTATDVLKGIPELTAAATNQKVSSLLNALVKDGRVTKAIVKGRSMFALA